MPMIITTEYLEDKTVHAAIAIDPMDVEEVEGNMWGRKNFSKVLLKSGAVHIVDVPAAQIQEQVAHVDEHAANIEKLAALGERVQDAYATRAREGDMAVYGGG